MIAIEGASSLELLWSYYSVENHKSVSAGLVVMGRLSGYHYNASSLSVSGSDGDQRVSPSHVVKGCRLSRFLSESLSATGQAHEILEGCRGSDVCCGISGVDLRAPFLYIGGAGKHATWEKIEVEPPFGEAVIVTRLPLHRRLKPI